MWKEIVEYIDKVSDKKNLDELMSLYLVYIAPWNPLKRVNQCQQYKIALDLIEIKKIMEEYSGSGDVALSVIHNKSYKTEYIQNKIKENKERGERITGIENLITREKKNIELAFILKNIENYHDYESLKFIVTILIAILSVIFTIKSSFDIIPSILK